MDDTHQERLLEQIVEDEIRRGYRVKAVPDELVAQLESAHADTPQIPVFRFIRLNKLTPKRKRLVAEDVQRRYHKDLQDSSILSNARLRQLNIERGEWSEAQEARMTTLKDETNRQMRALYLDGIDRRDEWISELLDLSERYRRDLAASEMSEAEQAGTLQLFERWVGFSRDRQADYDARFAESQGRTTYSPDKDLVLLQERGPTVELMELLSTIDSVRDRLQRYIDLALAREELITLQSKEAQMYASSVERRRETAEELARIYHGVERAEADGMSLGPLTPEFDDFWSLPDDLVEWLTVEAYFFYNGIPETARDYLAQWGFIPAPRENGSSASSGGSPEEPSSSNASPSAAATPADSLEPATATS